MTPATISRIARLYKATVGYNPIDDDPTTAPECVAAEALETLRWRRTAVFLAWDDPAAYAGAALRKPVLMQVKAMLDRAAALKARNINHPFPSWSDEIEAKRLCRRAAEIQYGML